MGNRNLRVRYSSIETTPGIRDTRLQWFEDWQTIWPAVSESGSSRYNTVCGGGQKPFIGLTLAINEIPPELHNPYPLDRVRLVSVQLLGV